MFILDGKPLPLDAPFTAPGGSKFPANWLRLSTPEEKEAVGITWQDDPLSWDERFYWGYDAEGKLIPKDHTQLVTLWTQQTRETANTMLTPTDWMIIREADNGIAADPAIKTWRETVRLACGSKVYEIEQTADTDALAAYITGPDYPTWPADPSAPVV